MIESLSFCLICCSSSSQENEGEEEETSVSTTDKFLKNFDKRKKRLFLDYPNASETLDNHIFLYFLTSKLLKLSESQSLAVVSVCSSDKHSRIVDKLVSKICLKCSESIESAVRLHYQVLELKFNIDAIGKDLSRRLSDKELHERLDDSPNDEEGEEIAVFKKLRGILKGKDQQKADKPLGNHPGIKREEAMISSDASVVDDGNDEDFMRSESTEFLSDFYRDNDYGGDAGASGEDERDPLWSNQEDEVEGEVEPNENKNPPANYRCKFCKSIYTSLPGYKKHLKMHKASNALGNKFDCQICNHPNLSEGKLRRHMTVKHDKNTCYICGHVAHRRHLHDRHMRVKHKIIVSHSGSGTNTKSAGGGSHSLIANIKRENNELELNGDDNNVKNLNNDSRSNSPEPSKSNVTSSQNLFLCDLCDSTYTTIPGFKKHRRAHKASKLLGNIYDCGICRHPNTSDANLRRHMTVVHNSKTVTNSILPMDVDGDASGVTNTNLLACTRCESTYTSIPGWNKHLRAHEESDSLGNQFDCQVCNHPNGSENKRRRHMNKFHNDKADTSETEENPESKVLSLSSSSLSLPLKRKKEKGVWSCPDYFKMLMTATGDPRYHCKFCTSVYTSRPGCKKHIRHHQESDQLGNEFDCKLCKHPTTSESKLRRHMSFYHNPYGKNREADNEDNLGIETEDSPEKDKAIPSSSAMQLDMKPVLRIRNSGGNYKVPLENSDEDDDEDYKCGGGSRKDDDWVPQGNSYRSKLDEESEQESSSSEDDSDSSDSNSKKKFKKSSGAIETLFNCTNCNVSYKSARGFQRHQEDHEASLTLNHKFDCKKCNFPCSSEYRLRYHLRRAHQEKSVKTRTKLKRINPSVKQIKRRGWSKYAKIAKQRDRTFNADGKKYECQICKISYLRPSLLLKHLEQHERNEKTDGKFDCDTCKFPCRDQAHLLRHKLKQHSESGRPTCHICKRKFYRPNKLRAHLVTHKIYDKALDRATGRYCCDLCEFQGTFRGFILHRNYIHRESVVSLSEEKSLCPQCGMSFTTREGLRLHIKNKHENIYRHNCEICGKGFEQIQPFKSHLKTHEKVRVREFMCSLCGVAYSYKKTLDAHMLQFHPDPNDVHSYVGKKARKEGSFPCKHCDLVFPFKYLLINHIPSAHPDVYRFKCDICQKAYISANSLKLHKEILHTSNPYSCEYCGKIFPHKQYVFGHYKSCAKKREMTMKTNNSQDKDGSNAMGAEEKLLNECLIKE